jgi:hypothetical protein
MMPLDRFPNTIPDVSVTDAIATCDVIPFGNYSGGFVIIPTTAGASVTSLTWYVSDKETGTYLPASDEDSVPIVQTVAHTNAYAIPSAIFGARFVKILANAAGTLILTVKG